MEPVALPCYMSLHHSQLGVGEGLESEGYAFLGLEESKHPCFELPEGAASKGTAKKKKRNCKQPLGAERSPNQ